MSPRIGLIVLVSSALATLSPGLAPAAAAPAGKACFFASQLSSWKEVGDRTVNLRVGVSDIYQLRLLAPCPDLPFAEAIGIETQAGSNSICSGLDVSLVLPRDVARSGPSRCMATSLRKLSPEEARALPPKEKP